MKTPSTMLDTMEITTAVGCLNACKVCPQERIVGRYRQTRGAGRMSLEHFRQCLDKIARHVRIYFSGFTEPWTNPDCTDMILHAHEAGFRVAVFTTCVGMTESDVERLKPVPFVTFLVHLPDDGSIMPFPKAPGYEAVLKRLCSEDLANIQFMAMGAPHPGLEGIVRVPVSGYLHTSRAGNLAGSRPVRKTGAVRCIPSPAMRRNVLLPNGDVVLCCHDYGMENVLGNLLVCGYEDLFAGPQYRSILARQNDEGNGDLLCRYCDWSASPLRARSIWGREVVKDTIRPIRAQASRLRAFMSSSRP